MLTRALIAVALLCCATPSLADEPENLLPVSYSLTPDNVHTVEAPDPLAAEPRDPVAEKKERQRRNQRIAMPAIIAFQIVNALDAYTTDQCVNHRVGCYETNPVFGHHPSTKKIYMIKGVTAVGHYLLSREMAKIHPALAYVFAATSGIPMAKMVQNNFRLMDRLPRK